MVDKYSGFHVGIDIGVQWWWLRSGGRWPGRCGALTPGVLSPCDTCGPAVTLERKLLAIGPSRCILYTCKEQVKFTLLWRDERRRGAADNACGTVQMSPSRSEQAAVSTQCRAVPCGDGRSRAHCTVAWFSWCFSSRGHGWVRARLLLSRVDNGEHGCLRGLCCSARPCAAQASVLRFFPQWDLLCFASHPSFHPTLS